MQVNKYKVPVTLEIDLTFHISAGTAEEANSLVEGHLAKIKDRQWEAPHAAPGITLIEEEFTQGHVLPAELVASDNP